MSAQNDPEMPNASCAAIICELAHYMDYWMREVRGSAVETDPVTGERRLLVCHEFYSHAHGAAEVLQIVGVLDWVSGSCHRWRMTLEECRTAEFPEFESPHNYLHCMATLDWILDGYVGFRDETGCVRIERYQALSPLFVERVAMRDDLFSIAADGAVFYLNQRFRDKVMTPWGEVLNKSLQKNGKPVAPVDWRALGGRAPSAS